ncbi:hypothetical protein NKI32_15355 [Mesorhizobium sp. M0761]|uniref:hypothetical protein n=1 Tax=unclassified Mesorhizobium TaxID=325217 RepID=UPI0012EC6CAE|nr:hypothetical protein [Mesorhizobium sp. LSHC414A00]
MSMIFHDPETRGLIRQGLKDIRDVGNGKPIEQTSLPPGTYVENGTVHLPPTGLGAAAALAVAGVSSVGGLILAGLAGSMLFAALRTVMNYNMRGVAIYFWIGVAIAILALGAFIYWIRDVRRLFIAGLLEIAAGTIGGVTTYVNTPDLVGRWLVIIAAAFAIADGIDKTVQGRVGKRLAR